MPTRPNNRPFLCLFPAVLLVLAGCGGGGGSDDALESTLTVATESELDTPSALDTPAVLETPTEPAAPIEPTLEELGVPVIGDNGNGAVIVFAALVEDVVAEALVEINQRVQGGETLNSTQTDCLGTFDPAFGESLLALDCPENRLPLQVENFSLQLLNGSMAATTDCNDGLLGLNGDSCRLVSADLFLPIEWVTPEFGLPRPFLSSFIEYNLAPNTLRISNLQNDVTGNYDCTFELTTASVSLATGFGNCTQRLDSVGTRLQAWLDRR